MTAGFRESGISGITDQVGRSTCPMVAVRSSGLALDSIIGFKPSPESSQISPMVSEPYLQTLLQVANDRFRTNEERKMRFLEALLHQPFVSGSSHVLVRHHGKRGYESAASRAERKRKEGMLRREQMLAYGGALDGASGKGSNKSEEEGNEDDSDSDYGFDSLVEPLDNVAIQQHP